NGTIRTLLPRIFLRLVSARTEEGHQVPQLLIAELLVPLRHQRDRARPELPDLGARQRPLLALRVDEHDRLGVLRLENTENWFVLENTHMDCDGTAIITKVEAGPGAAEVAGGHPRPWYH